MKKYLPIVVLSVFSMLLSSAEAFSQSLYGLTADNKIILVANPAIPDNVQGPYTISGITKGEQLMAIDFNPANGVMYGLGYNRVNSTIHLYSIDIFNNSYEATQIGMPVAITRADVQHISFDFDAATDNTIYIATGQESYVLNTVTGALTPEGNLLYTDTTGTTDKPAKLNAITYTNSFRGADKTSLYGYDAMNNKLVLFNKDGKEVLPIGDPGIIFHTGQATGMDSYYDRTEHNNKLFFTATPTMGEGSHLYTLDARTGKAIYLGAIGAGNTSLKDIAIKTDYTIPAGIEGNMIVALTLNKRNLVFFDSEHPGIIRNVVAVKGITDGQSLLCIDFRPVDMELYGLGYDVDNSVYQLYKIDIVSGFATAVNTLPAALALGGGNAIISGFDFDPVNDFVRVTGANGLNLRLNPVNGQVLAMDTHYAYEDGDALHGKGASIGAIAYTNSYQGADLAQMIGLDYNTGSIVNFSSPTDGRMHSFMNVNTILGTGSQANGYLDIYYDRAAKKNIGYLSANTNFNNEVYAEFYTIDPETGRTQHKGPIGPGIAIRDIAVQPPYQRPAAQMANGKLITYPNPVINYAHIILPDVTRRPVHLYLTDMQGGSINHYIYAPGGNQLGLDFTNFTQGTYSIRVHEEGMPVQFVRIIKQ